MWRVQYRNVKTHCVIIVVILSHKIDKHTPNRFVQRMKSLANFEQRFVESTRDVTSARNQSFNFGTVALGAQ